jgi:putative salt-induced outer membrane protein YdiY
VTCHALQVIGIADRQARIAKPQEKDMQKRSLLLLTLLFVLNQLAFADQLSLKNGDRISGAIIKSDGKTIVIKSEFAGEVTIQWDAVQSISSDKPLYIVSKEGQQVFGVVDSSQGRVEVATKEAGKVAFAKDVIVVIRSEAEQAAYEAQQHRLANPGLGDLWTGAADIGFSLSRGNSETSNFVVGINAARATTRDKISTYFTLLNTRSKLDNRSQLTADAKRGGIRYDVNLNPRLFAFGSADLENDKFQKLDLRLVLAAGLGFHVKKTETTTFDVFGGGAYNKELFQNGIRRNTSEVLIGEESSHKLNARSSFRQRAVLYPNLKERGEFRFAFDSSLVTNLYRALSWQVTLSDRYLSNPPFVTLKKNDLLFTTGLRFNFGNNK